MCEISFTNVPPFAEKNSKMKQSIVVLTVFMFSMTLMFISCENSAKKLDNAEKDVTEAKDDLEEAQQDYLKDMEEYRLQTANKIEANKRSISEFNARIENEKKEVKAEYKMKIAELEQKNSDMQKKIDEYKVEGKDQWELFKTEFNRDMDELGKALSNITVKNN